MSTDDAGWLYCADQARRRRRRHRHRPPHGAHERLRRLERLLAPTTAPAPPSTDPAPAEPSLVPGRTGTRCGSNRPHARSNRHSRPEVSPQPGDRRLRSSTGARDACRDLSWSRATMRPRHARHPRLRRTPEPSDADRRPVRSSSERGVTRWHAGDARAGLASTASSVGCSRDVYVPADRAGHARAASPGCVALVLPPHAVVVDRTAAWLWGVDVAEPVGARTCRRPRGLRPPRAHAAYDATQVRGGERDLGRRDIVAIGGVQVTTPVRTALDLACRPRAATRPRHARRLRTGAGRDAATDGASCRGSGADAAWSRRGELVPLVDARAESSGESFTRLAIHDAGLPAPEPQFWVYAGRCADVPAGPRLPAAQDLRRVRRRRVPLQSDEQRARRPSRREWLRDRGWMRHRRDEGRTSRAARSTRGCGELRSDAIAERALGDARDLRVTVRPGMSDGSAGRRGATRPESRLACAGGRCRRSVLAELLAGDLVAAVVLVAVGGVAVELVLARVVAGRQGWWPSASWPASACSAWCRAASSSSRGRLLDVVAEPDLDSRPRSFSTRHLRAETPLRVRARRRRRRPRPGRGR